MMVLPPPCASPSIPPANSNTCTHRHCSPFVVMVAGITVIAVGAGTVLVVAVVGGIVVNAILIFVVTKTSMAGFGCMAPPSAMTIVQENAHHERDCTYRHGALHNIGTGIS